MGRNAQTTLGEVPRYAAANIHYTCIVSISAALYLLIDSRPEITYEWSDGAWRDPPPREIWTKLTAKSRRNQVMKENKMSTFERN
jgi:hypothetical protein